MPSLILILNGPNLNMLGLREPAIYGTQTLDEIKNLCLAKAGQFELEIDFRQTNHEGVMVDWIQEAFENKAAGVIINAAGYTHTSVAIHDALKLLACPIVEVHLSNPKDREDFRHHSYIESVATAHFMGHGPQGYAMAIECLAEIIGRK